MTPEAHPDVVVVQANQTNSAGFWGFVLSLLGVTCCAGTCFSWVGLIVSLIGLGKQPRGFAIAGTVLGVIGSTGGLIFWSAGGKQFYQVATSVGAGTIPTYLSVKQAEGYVLESHDDTGAVPATLAEAIDPSLMFLDQWGTELVYRRTENGNGYSFHSAGPDVLWGTGDELSYTVPDADEPTTFLITQGTVRMLDVFDTMDLDELEDLDPPTGIEIEPSGEDDGG